MIISSNIFELRKLIQTRKYETILEFGEKYYEKSEYDTAKLFLTEGLKNTKAFEINYDDDTNQLMFLDVAYYFVLLGKIYLSEGNKFRAGENFVKALEKIVDRYPMNEFDQIVEKYQLEELLEDTGYKHKAFSGWFGKD